MSKIVELLKRHKAIAAVFAVLLVAGLGGANETNGLVGGLFPESYSQEAVGVADESDMPHEASLLNKSAAKSSVAWMYESKSQGDDAASAGEAENEEVVYTTRSGEKYHRGDCKYLKKSKIERKRSDAEKMGFEPCTVCNP